MNNPLAVGVICDSAVRTSDWAGQWQKCSLALVGASAHLCAGRDANQGSVGDGAPGKGGDWREATAIFKYPASCKGFCLKYPKPPTIWEGGEKSICLAVFCLRGLRFGGPLRKPKDHRPPFGSLTPGTGRLPQEKQQLEAHNALREEEAGGGWERGGETRGEAAESKEDVAVLVKSKKKLTSKDPTQ